MAAPGTCCKDPAYPSDTSSGVYGMHDVPHQRQNRCNLRLGDWGSPDERPREEIMVPSQWVELFAAALAQAPLSASACAEMQIIS